MPLPPGISTGTVTFGQAVSLIGGGDTAMTIEIKPTHNVVHAATGIQLLDFAETVKLDEGVPGSITLPHTDQAGFIDSSGNAFSGWAYIATGSWRRGNETRTFTKRFQILSGQTSIDLDLLPNGTITVPVSAPVLPVTSFLGKTGAIDEDDLVDLGVGGGGVADGGVTTAKLAADAVTGVKIASEAVSRSKLSTALQNELDAKLSEAEAAASYVPLWQASTAYAINAPVTLPNGKPAIRTAAGTSRTQFDATEEALWTVTGGATTVEALTDASTVGKAVAKAASAAAARSAIGASSLSADQQIDGYNEFTSSKGLRSTTYFGLMAGKGSPRMPHYENILINGSNIGHEVVVAGADDYVGVQTNVTFDGGFGTLVLARTGSMTAGQAVLTLSAGTFTSPIVVGWTVVVPGAGAGGGNLKAQITAITSTTTATLNVNAATTVSAAACKCSAAADYNFLFAANDFFKTGSAAGALDSISNVFGRLMEMHIYTPNWVGDTIKATSSELAIEASASGTTIQRAIGHHVKAVANKSTATIGEAIGLYVEGTPTPGATSSFGLMVGGGGRSRLSGATTILGGPVATDVALRLVLASSGSGDILATYSAVDANGAPINRNFHVGGNGSIGSSSFVVAFEGVASQVAVGQQTGGYAGLAFGSSQAAKLAMTADGVLRMMTGKAFGIPAAATAGRPAPSDAPQCLYWDSTLSKLAFSDGTTWKEIAIGAAV